MVTEIIPNLYVSDGNYAQQNGHNFDLIINCSRNVPFVENDTVTKIRLNIPDEPVLYYRFYLLINSSRALEIAYQHIQQKKLVLVHCQAGQQRSCAFIACLLVKYYDYDPFQAIELIKSKHPMAFFGKVNFFRTINMFQQLKIHLIEEKQDQQK